MSLRRSGVNPLSYVGVEATQPPQFEMHDRAPTANDYISFNVGTIWLDISGLSASPKVLPTNEQIYMLVSKNNRTATWVNLGGGDMETLTGDAGGAVGIDVNDNINLFGSHGINTLGDPVTNKITTAIDNAITLGDLSAIGAGSSALDCTTGDINIAAGNLHLPDTDNAGEKGVITLNGARMLHVCGDRCLFVGESAGNFGVSGQGNVGIGALSLGSLTDGECNCAIGHLAIASNTTGNDNIGIGKGAIDSITVGNRNTCVGVTGGALLLTGDHNLLLGYGAGSVINNAESNNIIVGSNPGVVGESNTIRIGLNGNHAGQQNKCFIAGVRGITTTVADAVPVLISSTHQLGVTSSSRRYKQNIKDMADESSVVMKLRPVTFNFKSHPDVPAWGLIAEEVAEVFPQLAVYNEDGSAETVKYHEIAVLLLNELQKMSKRLAVLEKKLKG